MTTTTTSRFRLPAVLLAVVTLVASLMVASGPDAQATHRPTVDISDGYRSDPPPFPSDCPCEEGTGSNTTINFDVMLSSPADETVTVDYTTSDGSAVAGQDYVAESGTITFDPGPVVRQTISIEIVADEDVEEDENFFVLLRNVSDTGQMGDQKGEGQIDNDDEPSLSISDGFADEPDEGSSGMSFTVELSDAAEQTVSVDFATEDGTAEAGADYEATSGTREFAPGETTTDPIVVNVHADDEDEGSEKFFVNLSNSEGAGIEDGRGEGLIGAAVVADAGPDRSGESEAPVSFVGSATDGSGDYSVTWDFGDDTDMQTGDTVTHHFPRTGTFNVVLTVKDNANGDTSTDTATATITDSGKVNRSSGLERISTAIDVSSDHWNQAGTVLLATAYNYPDALAAGPLSQKLDAPMLLTDTGDEVPDNVTAELDRLDANKVVVLGGAQAVPQAQADDLARSGYEVQRIADVSRFGTAADIAVEVGPTAENEVTVALGAHADQNQTIWADSLSTGSFAALPDPLPALLTHSDFVPDKTLDALEQLATDKVFLLGGTTAITPAVQAQLEAEGYTVQRVAGQNRFETSVEAGRIAMGRYPAGQVHPVFATGSNFPDGLTSGALAGKVTGPVVLVIPDDLKHIPGTRQFLRDDANRFDVGTVVGGEKVVSENVRTQARADIDTS